jgi:hypothetical protein
MYDTTDLWLPSEQAGINNLLAYGAQFLTDPTEHQKADGQVFISGRVGSN